MYAKRTVILENLYGVDIDDGAVEICKLRLWLSMVADIEDEPNEVEPLPNIDFNIRQGNSLIGFTDLIEVNQNGDAPLTNFGGGIGEGVREKYEDIIAAVEKHRNAGTAKEAANWRKEAERRLSRYRNDLNEKVLAEFYDSGIEDITLTELEDQSPFHWVLEFASVYAAGGFDIVIGNPPWDKVKAERDDFFPQYDETFRNKMPEQKDAKQQELLDDPDIRSKWEEYKENIERKAEYFNTSPNYSLQETKIDGRTVSTENDLSALFLERVFNLLNEEGYVSQVLPGVTFNGGSKKALREYLLDKTEMKALAIFENRGIFENIDTRYNFGVLVFKNSGRTEEVIGTFQKGNVKILQSFDNNALHIPRSVLSRYSPEAKIFPNLEDQNEVNIIKKIVQHPPLIEDVEGAWHAEPYRELDRTNDTDRFVESIDQGDYPVLGGGNIYQFSYDNQIITDLEPPKFWSVAESENPEKSAKRRIREKDFRKLKKGLYDDFDGSGSQIGFVNDLLEKHRGDDLKEDDVLLDCR